MSGASTTLERELKLVVWPEFELPDLSRAVKGATVGEPVHRHLDAVYYDTGDLRLLRQGITLRRRQGEGDGPQWTLKLPTGSAAGGLSRSEISLPARGPLPRHLKDLTLGWALGAEIVPVARMVTDRTSTPLTTGSGAALASIDDDDVMVERDGHVVARFRELEVELAPSALAKHLTALAKRLESAGAQPAPQVPKLVRALGSDAAEPEPLAADDAEPDETAAALAHRLAAVLRDRIVVNHAPLVLGDDGAARELRDGVHDIGTTLRAFAPILADKVVDRVSRELEWLERQLGPSLVLEHQHRGLRSDRSRRGREIAAATGLELEAAAARRLRALRSQRYRRLLADLAALAADPPVARRMRLRPLAKVRRRCSDPAMASARVAIGAGRRLPSKDAADLRDALERLACILAADHPARADLATLVATLRDADEHAAAARVLERLTAPGTEWARGVLAGRHAQQADDLREAALQLWQNPKRASRWGL